MSEMEEQIKKEVEFESLTLIVKVLKEKAMEHYKIYYRCKDNFFFRDLVKSRYNNLKSNEFSNLENEYEKKLNSLIETFKGEIK